MHSLNWVAGIAVGVLACGTASAAWTGKGTFGGVLARGNTDTETINAVLDVAREGERWTHRAGASWLRTVNDDVTSADRWELRGESNYDLTERSHLFGTLRYEDDRFTDFKYQGTAAVGYGYHFIATDRTKLEGQIGPGVRRTERRTTGEENTDAIGRGAVNFEHKLTGTTLVYDRFLVESGSDNTFYQNQLGIEVKMTDVFALGLDYTMRHNTDVEGGKDKTDSVVTANLVYSF